jgi:hypothetical protein
MKNRFPRNLFVLTLVTFGVYLYTSAGKPAEKEIKPLILKALQAPDGSKVSGVEVGRAMERRRLPDATPIRTWPVHATVTIGSSVCAVQDFYVWRTEIGAWTAEVDPLVQPLEKPGPFQLSRILGGS